MNSNEPGSSGVVTAADSIETTTETTTQHPAAVEIGKQASERAREASERAREAAGRAAQQESGVEQAREVGASGATQAALESGRRRPAAPAAADRAGWRHAGAGAWRLAHRATHAAYAHRPWRARAAPEQHPVGQSPSLAQPAQRAGSRPARHLQHDFPSTCIAMPRRRRPTAAPFVSHGCGISWARPASMSASSARRQPRPRHRFMGI